MPSPPTAVPAPTTDSPTIFWNQTAARTYLFDAFSVMLPEGEAFVMDAVSEAARDLPPGCDLHLECARFINEEEAHQRAHRLYNARLEQQGHHVAAMEARIAHDLRTIKTHLSADQRLCLAAAFEHVTATISAVALRSERVLTSTPNPQTRLWRWHCAEEMAHLGVTVDLMAARDLSYGARVGWFLVASVVMLGDVLRHMRAFYRHDVGTGRLSASRFWISSLAGSVRALPDLWSTTVGWASYLLPRFSTKKAASVPITVRELQAADVQALMALEHACWTDEQAAQASDMLERMRRHPEHCLGAFCPRTGRALASLFMKPTCTHAMSQARTWRDCIEGREVDAATGPDKALFGISLSSIDPQAVKAIFSYFWPHALKGGWRYIFLGSPIPGLANWLQNHPQGNAQTYVRQRRHGLPLDPQLRYYHRKGFRHIEAVLPNYFPHARSLDHGVLLRGQVPGARWAPLWRRVSLSRIQAMQRWLSRLP
ncbi:putative metal-dependent hydrolase [Hydrogenophaga palleronii]|uniref:Metal-dependent hydrolase n=1 Tax=Hydrogenophaga palleronii TaxID=65655 RepID=A0ABU1WR87_9BURK|nr:metal-dependent hydrolase [Hydrogenophaga palleronii]MDR7151694.1 putative metal-dependent hydrolase [Hydrogenophaga palleronii]